MSIKKIKFYLKEVSSEEVKKIIKSLNKKKLAICSCIPVKVLIDSVDTYLPVFTNIINSSIRNGTFPEEPKLAEVTPLFKKGDPFDKVKNRSVILLSHVSKVYERIIFNQISTYFEPYFSSFLTLFNVYINDIVLGVTIDNHLKNLCKKIANKLNELKKIAPYLNHNQIRLMYNLFFKGQLSYCPLIWSFCSRCSNHLINKLQEQARRF